MNLKTFAFLGFCASASLISMTAYSKDAANTESVLLNYTTIARATYEDAYISAQALRAAIGKLVEEPTDAHLKAARTAWLAARVPYQQSEVFRFGNPLVDEWEGKVNSWPLDEGLIDYVDASYGITSDTNAFYNLNIIANPKAQIGGQSIDATRITPDLVRLLQEIGGVEANVATGYHAIEFLLWGQDLNGTKPGAGNRPATDYSTAACTGGNCDRRAAYLLAVTGVLVDDLKEMSESWGEAGAARQHILDGKPEDSLTAMITGIGSLSYGELAGERMKLGLLLHDPEEEHDCFSDNTHNSHYYDSVGMRNVYTGTYKRIDGSTVSGPSLSDLVKAKDAKTDADVRQKLDRTVADMAALKKRAEGREAYDQMIGEGNVEGNAAVQKAIDALITQTRSVERVVNVLSLNGIEFEGSDSLDKPDAVFQ
jgi:putative iron-regulated protein